MEFDGKVIIITGASSGIGADAARYLAKLGAKVVMVGRNQHRLNEVASEIKESGCETPLALVADVRKDSKRIIDESVAHFGKMDVLVNNAGIYAITQPDADIEVYDRIFDTNVRSIIELCKEAVPHLERTKGNIVNVSSISGMMPISFQTFYSMSKAALDQFTQCAANEFARKSIRVNAVNPGIIETPMLEAAGITLDSVANEMKIPVGRNGHVSDVSRCIAFLASDRAAFVTGTLLKVDGGLMVSLCN